MTRNPLPRVTQGGDDLFFFISRNYVSRIQERRDCALGAALKNADTQALDVYFANGFKITRGEDSIDAITNSKTLIAYFLQHPDKLDLSLQGYGYNQADGDLVSYMISSGAKLDNVMFAIENSDARGAYDSASKQYQNGPLQAAIGRTSDKDAAAKKDGLAIMDTLLKRGASPKADMLDQSAYYSAYQSPLFISLKQGSPEATKMLVQAGGDADAVLQALLKNNENPYKLQGWDALRESGSQ